ncbi:MAG: hypothetical protein QOE33_1926 [Acidobacteriota bacterium]|nr:hypothetical protein [Acidobacteriota bacterium]
MTDYLFVCGTLLPDRAPREIAGAVSRLRSVGAATVKGRLYDLGAYPGAILDASTREKISGWVFALPRDQSALKSLDEYENYKPHDPAASLFIRKRTSVELSDGRELECWMYVYNRDPGDAPLVPGGDYAKSKTV